MTELSDRTFAGISELMHGMTGVWLSPAKKALTASRLAPRIQRLGLAAFDDYLRLLQSRAAADELQVAIDLLTTNETYFFRERAHFDQMEQEFSRGPVRDPVRVWSAASSFGDEAYSIAMVLADLQMQGRVGPRWSVLGTDISDRVLRTATEAVYPEERLREVTPQRLKRHCLRGEGDSAGLVMMGEHLTRHVQFGRLNLNEPIDLEGPFDVIFLRNVLIYFDADTKREVVRRVTEQLRPGGLFFIGMAEGRVGNELPLTPLGPGAFRKALS